MDLKSHNNILKWTNDQHFLEWVYYPSEELDNYWNQYMLMHPHEKADIEEARLLLTGILQEGNTLSQSESELLLEKIKASIKPEPKLVSRRRMWMAAAGILLVIGIGSLFTYLHLTSQKRAFDYASIASDIPDDDDVTLILSDNSTETLYSENVELHYNEDGAVVTGSGQVLEQAKPVQEKEMEQFNQIIVPRGRRSSIVLADGTRLWLNSGTRAIYPVTFNKKTREIYIEGEAYLEVAPDTKRPFHVKTDRLDVKVLGTKFNISSYPDENISSVVLVEGSVKASAGSKTVLISPNQIFSHESQTGKTSLKTVNVLEHISWKEGWLIFKNDNLGSIIPVLSRYYNINIEMEDKRVQDLTISGKLDLKANYMDVIRVITTTAPLDYEIVNEKLRLKMKK